MNILETTKNSTEKSKHNLFQIFFLEYEIVKNKQNSTRFTESTTYLIDHCILNKHTKCKVYQITNL